MTGQQSQVQKTSGQAKQWRGRTVFKIKKIVKLPEELSNVKSSSKIQQISDPSDEVKPAYPPSGEKAEKPKPSSSTGGEGKSSGSSSSGLKRRPGHKTTTAENNEEKQFLDEFERELDKAVEMELHKSV